MSCGPRVSSRYLRSRFWYRMDEGDDDGHIWMEEGGDEVFGDDIEILVATD